MGNTARLGESLREHLMRSANARQAVTASKSSAGWKHFVNSYSYAAGVDVAMAWRDSAHRDPRLSGLKSGQRHLNRAAGFMQLGERRQQLPELGHLRGQSRGGTFHPTTTSLI
jgi:hypothetical protein